MNSSAHPNRLSHWLDGAAFALFLSLLTLAPLWYGSFPVLARAGNGLAAALIALVLILLHVSGGRIKTHFKKIAVSGTLGICVVTWCWMQQSAFAPPGTGNLIWNYASIALGSELPGRISIYPEETRLICLSLATSMLVFWEALQLGRDIRRARLILLCIALGGGLYSFYGLYNFIFDLHTVLFKPNMPSYVEYGGAHATYMVSATFVNRSHFAAYAGLSIIAASAWFYEWMQSGKFRRDRNEPAAHRRQIALASTIGIFALITASACIMTGSRAGVATSFFGVITLFGLLCLRLASWRAIIVALVLVLMIMILAILAGKSLFLRLDAINFSQILGSRGSAYEVATTAIASNFWLGYGAFVDAFAQFRESGMEEGLTWNAAHNSFLEAAIDLGVPAALMLVAAIANLVLACFRGVFLRDRGIGICAAAAAAAMQIALHSTIDFPVQTPAVALILAALLGAGVAQSWSSRKPSDPTPVARLKIMANSAPVATVAMLALSVSVLILQSRWSPVHLVILPSAVRQISVEGILFQDMLAERLEEKLLQYEQAIAARDQAKVADIIKEATILTRTMLERQPAAASLWALLAELNMSEIGFDQDTLAYIVLSDRTGPYENLAVRRRVNIGMANWKSLDSVRQAFLRRDLRTIVRIGPFEDVMQLLVEISKGKLPAVVEEVRSAIAETHDWWAPHFDRMRLESRKSSAAPKLP